MNNEQLREEFLEFCAEGKGSRTRLECANYLVDVVSQALSHQKAEKISEYGFKELVEIAREMLAKVYPLDVFDGNSEDTGPRFTAKLHEALSLLDTPTNPQI